jgi:hypothetical protein
MDVRTGGVWLIGAATLFWLSWLLMPGVGITDARLILDLVSSHRLQVQISVVAQLVSAGCYAPAVIAFLGSRSARSSHSVRWACALLLIGAMGSAADAIFHLMAVYLTDPALLGEFSQPLMRRIQGPGLIYLLPMIGAFFAGSYWLARALSQEGTLSCWTPRLFPAALALALVAPLLPAETYRSAALAVLLLVSAAQAWIGVSWIRSA